MVTTLPNRWIFSFSYSIEAFNQFSLSIYINTIQVTYVYTQQTTGENPLDCPKPNFDWSSFPTFLPKCAIKLSPDTTSFSLTLYIGQYPPLSKLTIEFSDGFPYGYKHSLPWYTLHSDESKRDAFICLQSLSNASLYFLLMISVFNQPSYNIAKCANASLIYSSFSVVHFAATYCSFFDEW